jgi:tripartite-type tricarboxylate transporter receptor subunit TctC
VTDLIGGQIQLYMSSVPTLIGHIRNGKMRAIAVTSDKRVNDLPNVPTIAESGYKGFEAVTWFGVVGPTGLPKDVVAKLNAGFNKALQDADVKKKLEAQGADVLGSTPEKFASLIRDETVRWGKIVKESGAKVD